MALVAHVVPEQEHPVRSAQKARAVDDIGVAFEDGGQELRIVARIVLQVGVLDDDDLAAHLGLSGPERCPLASVALMAQDDEVGPDDALEELGRRVGRAIVHDDELFLLGRPPHAGDHLRNRRSLVIDRDDHREQRAPGVRGRSSARSPAATPSPAGSWRGGDLFIPAFGGGHAVTGALCGQRGPESHLQCRAALSCTQAPHRSPPVSHRMR